MKRGIGPGAEKGEQIQSTEAWVNLEQVKGYFCLRVRENDRMGKAHRFGTKKPRNFVFVSLGQGQGFKCL
jgi:hypothetical protein